MANVAITGHGDRSSGTASGTYVVPKGVTIYFFVKDDQVLYSGASDQIMYNLCSNSPNEVAVRAIAVDVRREFETIPNYTCYGTEDFEDPTGVYMVGKPVADGPIVPILNNTEVKLSDIIGGSSSGGVIGNHVYWLCCRATPDNSNLIDDNKDIITGQLRVGKKKYDIGATEVGSDMGLKPSKVKKRGGRWR